MRFGVSCAAPQGQVGITFIGRRRTAVVDDGATVWWDARFWDDADAVVSSRLLYVETAAALTQARRMDRLTDEEHDEAIGLLDRLWSEIDIAEIDQSVVSRVAVLARRFALRGYYAVHCVSGEWLDDDEVVAASGDQQLLRAWAELGMATYDSNAMPKPVTDEASSNDVI